MCLDAIWATGLAFDCLVWAVLAEAEFLAALTVLGGAYPPQFPLFLFSESGSSWLCGWPALGGGRSGFASRVGGFAFLGRVLPKLAGLAKMKVDSKAPPIARVCGLPWGVFAMTLDQRIVYWGRGARELLGYAPSAVVGQRCADIPSGLDRYGLTSDCGEGCVCLRSARVGIVPSPSLLEMRCSWGELKTVDVTPLALVALVALVALGWRNEYIADELGVTLNTVRAHGAGNR